MGSQEVQEFVPAQALFKRAAPTVDSDPDA